MSSRLLTTPMPDQPAAPPVPQGAALPPTTTQPPTLTVPGQGVAGTQTAPRIFTKEGIEALRSQRSELSRQLTSAQGRRDDAAKELNRATSETARTGIEQRLIVLDDRILQLEKDIASTGQDLAYAQVATSSSTVQAPRYGPFSSKQLTAISIVSVVLVWAPLAFALSRIMLKRWAVPKPAPQVLASAERLERMEQSIDAVAIEIERISEGQRFVTQLMAKTQQAPALKVGQAPAES